MNRTSERYRYARMVGNVRLLRHLTPSAEALQRKGYTLREIADRIRVPVKGVQQTLYWDKVK